MLSNTNGCARIESYEAAERYFNATQQPRSKHWSDWQRPLDDARKYHYRLEQRTNSYEVVLYHTTMATYHKPEPDGTRRVNYNWHESKTSSMFMSSACGIHSRTPTFTDTEGTQRHVPLAQHGRNGSPHDLWFDARGRLIVERSTHEPIVQLVKSAALKEYMKAFKCKTDTLFALMEIRIAQYLPTIETEATAAYQRSAFRSMEVNFNTQEVARAWRDQELGPCQMGCLIDLLETTARWLVQVRQDTYARARSKFLSPYRSGAKEPEQPKPVTPKEVTRSVLGWFERHAPYHVSRPDRVPLAMFPTELPSKWSF